MTEMNEQSKGSPVHFITPPHMTEHINLVSHHAPTWVTSALIKTLLAAERPLEYCCIYDRVEAHAPSVLLEDGPWKAEARRVLRLWQREGFVRRTPQRQWRLIRR